MSDARRSVTPPGRLGQTQNTVSAREPVSNSRDDARENPDEIGSETLMLPELKQAPL
jgi:hypothetical protein